MNLLNIFKSKKQIQQVTSWGDPKAGQGLSLQGTLDAGGINQSNIVPAMYQAWGAYGYQPSVTWYQLCNMFVSWEYTAVEKIARTLSSLPAKLYRYEKVGTGKTVKPWLVKSMLYGNYGLTNQYGNHYKTMKDAGIKRVEVDEHPFLDLVNNPNPDIVRSDFWRLLAIHLELNGAVGIYKTKYKFGNPTELYILPTTWTGQFKPVPDLTGERLISKYRLIDQDLNTEFDHEEIIWPHYTSLRNPFEGMSAIKAQLYAFNIDQYLNQQITSFYKNGAMFSNMFETEQQLTQEQYDTIAGQLTNYQGAKNAFQKFILHSGLKVSKPMNTTAREAMVQEVETMARDKILSAHDMSAGKIGLTAHQNRSNLEVVDMGFFNECIRPRAMLITEYFDKYCVKNYDENLDFEFDYPHFEDKTLQLHERQQNLSTGYSSINEEREKSGEVPVEGGDVHFVSPMLVPLADAARSIPKQPILPSPVIPEEPAKEVDKTKDFKGGAGSGHHEHETHPDKRGGSLPRGVSISERIHTTGADGKPTKFGRTTTIRNKVKKKAAFWTPERKAIAWKKFDKVATGYEPLFKKIVGKLHDYAAALAVDKLEQNGVKVKTHIGSLGLERRKIWIKENKARMDEVNPNKEDIKNEYKRLSKPVYLGIIEQVGNDRIKEFTAEMAKTKAKKVEIKFDVSEKAVQEWIKKRMEKASESISKTLSSDIRDILEEGFENGMSQVDIAREIRETLPEDEAYRADNIARTESTAVTAQADLEGIRQLGIGGRIGKVWLDEQDERVRDSHAAAGERYSDGYDKVTGEPVRIDDEFIVGEDSMVAPANGEVAEENVNCRCGMVYEVLPESEEDDND